jgi:hypothetical protein
MSKSKLMVLNNDFYGVYNLPNVAKVESVKICGVIFGHNSCQLNQNVLYSKLQKAITFFKTKGLTYYSKVTLLTIVLLSKLWYVGSVIVFDKKFIKMVNKLLFHFLWPSVEWLKRDVIFLPKLDGGLGLLDVACRCKTFRIKHIWLVLQDSTHWCHAFSNYWIGFPLSRLLSINLSPHSETPSPFYKTASNDFRIYLNDSNYDCNNKFVFKTAYLRQLSNKNVSINVVSRYPAVNFANIWKSLYKLPLTLESRQVWWLVLHRVLPVRERLAKLRIISASNCLFCSIVKNL